MVGVVVGQKLAALVEVIVGLPKRSVEQVFATAAHIPPKPVLALVQLQLILLHLEHLTLI
jgi:hypothetical protein